MSSERAERLKDALEVNLADQLKGKPETYRKLNLREAVDDVLKGSNVEERSADIKDELVPLEPGAPIATAELEELANRLLKAPDLDLFDHFKGSNLANDLGV